jgi:integrase
MEVKRVFTHVYGVTKLMAGLLYGSGLRLMECLRLRVKDVDFELAQITVRDAKGGKDRITMLPLNVSEPLRRHLGAGEGATRAGCRRWIRQRSSSICVKPKAPERGTRMGLAICFSFIANFRRSSQPKKTSHG